MYVWKINVTHVLMYFKVERNLDHFVGDYVAYWEIETEIFLGRMNALRILLNKMPEIKAKDDVKFVGWGSPNQEKKKTKSAKTPWETSSKKKKGWDNRSPTPDRSDKSGGW